MSETGQPPAEEPSAGQLLREAREAAGLHIATLAANLKVPVRKLEALEEDRYDELPDAVFVRALASSVARTLKIDPHPVLERLPQGTQPRLVQDQEGINAPFRAPGDAPGQGWLDQVSRPVVLTVFALLLAAVVLIFLPVAQRHGESASQQASNEPVMPPGTPAVITPPSENPPAAGASAPGETGESADTAPSAAPAPAPVAATPTAPAASTPAARAASAPARTAAATALPAAKPASAVVAAATPAATPSSGPIAAKGIVTFRTKGSSWVQVTDAHGTAVLRKLMEAGETAGASGALPLSITIGSVEQTEVEVRGKPFNLQPVSHDNVARFQVN